MRRRLVDREWAKMHAGCRGAGRRRIAVWWSLVAVVAGLLAGSSLAGAQDSVSVGGSAGGVTVGTETSTAPTSSTDSSTTPAPPPEPLVVKDVVIAHVPVASAFYGRSVTIDATADCASVAACSMSLLYRTTQSGTPGGWTRVAMAPGAPTAANGRDIVPFSAAIPGVAVGTRGVDYVLEALDAAMVGRLPQTTAGPGSVLHVTTVSPPVVTHVPAAAAQPDRALPVSLQASCSTATCSAEVLYRIAPDSTATGLEAGGLIKDPQWPSKALRQTAALELGDAGRELTFEGEIPADVVTTSGVDYLLRVTDGETTTVWPGTAYFGHAAPTDSQHLSYHHVRVLESTKVVHQPPVTAAYRKDLPITGTASCPVTQTCTARLHWRTTDKDALHTSAESDFTSAPMAVVRGVSAGDLDTVTVTGEIPASFNDTRGVDYFFSVSDGQTTAWYPGTSQIDGYVAVAGGKRVAWQHVRVLEPPHIAITPQLATPALEPYAVSVRASCATPSCVVKLHYTSDAVLPAPPVGDHRAYKVLEMTAVGESLSTSVLGDLSVGTVREYRATIPAAEVTTRGLAFYVTADDGHTSAYAPGLHYEGAYLPRTDSSPSGPLHPTTNYLVGRDGEDRVRFYNAHEADIAFPVRVLEAPHPVSDPIATADRGKALDIDVTSNCSSPSCEAKLKWRGQGGTWREQPMAAQPAAAGVILPAGATRYRATIPAADTDVGTIAYAATVDDGYAQGEVPTMFVETSRASQVGPDDDPLSVPEILQPATEGQPAPRCQNVSDPDDRLTCAAGLWLLSRTQLAELAEVPSEEVASAIHRVLRDGANKEGCQADAQVPASLGELACEIVAFYTSDSPELGPKNRQYLTEWTTAALIGYVYRDKVAPVDCTALQGVLMPLSCRVAFKYTAPPEWLPRERDYLARYATLGRLAAPRCDEFGGTVLPFTCLVIFTQVVPGQQLSEQQDQFTAASDPVTSTVAKPSVDPARAAVIDGHVRDRSGTPIAEVNVSIKDHPEMGQVTTDEDGTFAFRLTGGARVRLRYTKPGYLTSDRVVQTRWKQHTEAPDVVLVKVSPEAVDIDLDGATGQMQVVRAPSVTDEDGTRRSVLLFQAGTRAAIELNGGDLDPVASLRVRATEFTVGDTGPKAMPADLPYNSAYTYAIEFSADEVAERNGTGVAFSAPVVNYTENFLGFDTGEIIPAGYYDRRRGAWLAADGILNTNLTLNGLGRTSINVDNGSGRVVKVLREAEDKAILDVDGSGNEANDETLNALGVTADELEQVARLYEPGQSLWRVPLAHFTPYDYNWPPELDDDARDPDAEFPDDDDEDGCEEAGSIIECESQTLGEQITVPGTDVTLRYSTARAPGRFQALPLTLIRGDAPQSLLRVKLHIEAAGRSWDQTFQPQSDLRYEFEFDGKDAAGADVSAQDVPVTARVTYVYKSYQYPGATRFADPPTRQSTRRESRVELERSKVITATIPARDGRDDDQLGGWTVEGHHRYNAETGTLHRGDASTLEGLTPLDAATELAGTGPAGDSGDGGPASDAQLQEPSDVLALPDGSTLIADTANHRIRRVAPDGTITTAYGDGECGNRGDGFEARDARLCGPDALNLGVDGSVYFLDGCPDPQIGLDLTSDSSESQVQCRGNARIRRITPRGRIFTIARPVDASSRWTDLAVAEDGTLFVTDPDNRRIEQIDPDDRRSLLVAEVDGPSGVTVAPDSSVYFSEAGTSRIRRVLPDGDVVTVAGGGERTRDGGAATASKLKAPGRLVVDADGSVLFVDTADMAVRRINANGTLTTVAGRAAKLTRSLPDPRAVAVQPDGTILVAGGNANRVHLIAQPGDDSFTGAVSFAAPDGDLIWTFDSDGQHLRTRSSLSGALLAKFSYDAAGRMVTITDSDDQLTTITRDDSGRPTAITDPYGRKTTLASDEQGNLASVREPGGRTWTLAYGTGGLLRSFTDPSGATSSFTYESGRLVQDVDADGGSKTLTRSETADGHDVRLTTAEDRITRYRTTRTPDGGLIRTQTDGGGSSTTTTIDAQRNFEVRGPDGSLLTSSPLPDPRFGADSAYNGRVEQRTPSGRTLVTTQTRTVTPGSDPVSPKALSTTIRTSDAETSVSWDRATRKLTSVTPAGRTSTVELDERERPVRAARPGVLNTVSRYDARGRLSQIEQGARRQSYDYDGHGRLATITDADGTETLSYDDNGDITRRVLPDGRVVTYVHDAAGNITSITPPSRPAQTFSRSKVGLTTGRTRAATQTSTVTYDRDHRPKAASRPDESRTTFSYDNAGRLAGFVDADGTTSYERDASGRVTRAARGDRVLATTFDGALPLTTTTSGPFASSLTRSYDHRWRVAGVTIAGTPTVDYAYDADGLATRVGELALELDGPTGRLAGTTLNNVSSTHAFDELGEPRSTSYIGPNGTLLGNTLTYDAAGRITSKTETVLGVSTTYSYIYTASGRLASVSKEGFPDATYAYDAQGNRTATRATGQPQQSATVDEQDRLLTQGTLSFSYDANGQRTKTSDNATGKDTTYGYDAQGNLIRVSLPGGKEISYVLDAEGRRIVRKVDGSFERGYVYADDSLQPSAEVDASGSVTARYVYATRATSPDYLIKGGQTYRLLSDERGSIRLVVDAFTGAVAQRIEYDPYGRVLDDSAPGFQSFGYAGGLTDVDTALVHFDARELDPNAGRWLTLDPIGLSGGLNEYAYVGGDPINAIDPTGNNALSDYAADTLDGLTGGVSTSLAGKAFGFDPDCSSIGDGPAAQIAGVVGFGKVKAGVNGARGAVNAVRKTDRIKQHATPRDLDAARRELGGEVVKRKPDGTPYDHVGEVRDAQRGLLNRIETIKQRLGYPGLTQVEREALQDELGDASRLLDHTEDFAPRP